MILISSPQRVPRPSCPFRGKFGRRGKRSSNEKAEIVYRGSLCHAPDSTGSKVQYEPHLFSEACSQTELSISGKIWRSSAGQFTKKLKSLLGVPYVAHLKMQVLSCNMNLISSPQRAPRPSYPFRGKFWRSGKGSFTEKLKSFKDLPYVLQVKEHVLSFNMILISFQQRLPRLSYPFQRNFGRSGKGSFTQKA